MIITTPGVKMDLTATAEQFGITTPVSLSMDSMTVPDSAVIVPVTLVLGAVVFLLFRKKLLKGR